MLVGGVLITAFLCTLMVKGGWMIWLPVMLALGILAVASNNLNRP